MREPSWAQRYRPATVADCVLPPALKRMFQSMIDKNEVPNLLLVGQRGVGKTTVAQTMCRELGYASKKINSSLYGNIDILRTDIVNYASTYSLDADRKVVILDEADYLNDQSTQPALRAFMEDYSEKCGFILTANHQHLIIPELREGRTSVIDFLFPPNPRTNTDAMKLCAEFIKRIKMILEKEKITYNPKVIAEVVFTMYPNFRGILSTLQTYSARGCSEIDSGVLAVPSDLADIILMLKAKDFGAARRWIGETTMNPSHIFRRLYDTAYDHVHRDAVPDLVMIIAEHQDKATRVADQEINLASMFAMMMTTLRWRDS